MQSYVIICTVFLYYFLVMLFVQYFVTGFYSSGYRLCLHSYRNVHEDLLVVQNVHQDLLLVQKCARGFTKLPVETEVSNLRG